MAEASKPTDSPDSEADTAVTCEVVPVDRLSALERTDLLQLMQRQYEGVDERQFFADLDEKRSIVLMRTPSTQAIRGFATITLVQCVANGKPIAAIFAGDTVMDPALWGRSTWVYAWGSHAYDMAQQSDVQPVYFFLLTSTHRSYKFLPAFFREYYPDAEKEIPASVQADLDALARSKFPHEYDSQRGLVILNHAMQVRTERRDPAAQSATDDTSRYFFERNPNFENSDYLTCIALFTWENLTRLGRRIVMSGK